MPNTIREWREARNFTQVQVAHHIGVARSTVIRWENGETIPYEYHLEKLCELFGVTASQLGFSLSDETEPEPSSPSPPPSIERKPSPPQEHPSTYFVQDRSDANEQARLIVQDALVTRLVGTLPDDIALPQHVLDVGCGTGGWLIEVAKTHPEVKELIGVDISKRMLDFAREQAEIAGVSSRVTFRVMDALRMLEFADSSFDLINHRFAASWLRTWDWQKLLQEYKRVTRKWVLVSEAEGKIESSSDAYAQWWRLMLQAFRSAGHIPAIDFSFEEWLSPLFAQHGFQNITSEKHHLEYFGQTPMGLAFAQDIFYAMKTSEAFLQKWIGVAEYKALCQQVQEDLSGHFHVITPVISVRGEKG